MDTSSCCTCAKLLSALPHHAKESTSENSEKSPAPLPEPRRLGCCGRTICGICIHVRIFFFFSFVVCESTERPFIQISGLSTVVEMRCGNTERSARPRTRSTTNSHIEQQPICTLLPILPNLHGSLQLAPNRAQRPAVVRLRNSSNIPPAHRGAAAVQHDRRAATVSTRKGRKDGSGNNDHQRRLSDPPLPRPQAR